MGSLKTRTLEKIFIIKPIHLLQHLLLIVRKYLQEIVESDLTAQWIRHLLQHLLLIVRKYLQEVVQSDLTGQWIGHPVDERLWFV